MSAFMTSFVYITVLCFDVSAENCQIALIIIQPIWYSHFLEINIYFRRCHFFHNMWTKDVFDVDMPTIVLKSSYRRYPSNEKWDFDYKALWASIWLDTSLLLLFPQWLGTVDNHRIHGNCDFCQMPWVPWFYQNAVFLPCFFVKMP